MLSPALSDKYLLNDASPIKKTFQQNILSQKDKYKTELCKNKGYMRNGICTFGDKCVFAHGSKELRRKVKPNPKYKTEICKLWKENGACTYGARCLFVHRREEEKSINVAKENKEVMETSLSSSSSEGLEVFRNLRSGEDSTEETDSEDPIFERLNINIKQLIMDEMVKNREVKKSIMKSLFPDYHS